MAKDPYKYFRVEARELLDGLSQGILQLEKDTPRPRSWLACCAWRTRSKAPPVWSSSLGSPSWRTPSKASDDPS